MNKDERERERLVAIARNKVDAKPIIEELRDAGFAVESISDLFNMKMNYQNAIPVLVKWLPLVSNQNVKEDIVRALSVKWAKDTLVTSLLFSEFKRAEDSTGMGLRWAIGNALEVLADDSIANEMISLVRDQRYGRAREMVVLGLGKLKDPRITEILIGLLSDEEVAGHAAMALGKLRAKEARPQLENLLKHRKAFVRSEAKKALKRLTGE